MPRFHVTKAGNPGKCDAKIKCPLGGDFQDDHYDTPQEVREAYEAKQKKANGGNLNTLKKPRPRFSKTEPAHTLSDDDLMKLAKTRGAELQEVEEELEAVRFENKQAWASAEKKAAAAQTDVAQDPEVKKTQARVKELITVAEDLRATQTNAEAVVRWRENLAAHPALLKTKEANIRKAEEDGRDEAYLKNARADLQHFKTYELTCRETIKNLEGDIDAGEARLAKVKS